MTDSLLPQPPPLVPDRWQAQYAAIYLALHHISCAVRDAIDKIEQANPKHRIKVLRERMEELTDAALAINMYDSTPPEEIARTYEQFLTEIASNAHLRTSNRNLAANFRAVEDMLADVGDALGGGLTGPEIVERVKALVEDSARLEWLLNYITTNGLNGMRTLAWTSYDEDGKSLMDRAAVSEDEVAEVKLDRASIDLARKEVK